MSMAKQKSFPLVLIQTAWVLEVMAVILYTMAIVLTVGIEKVNLWLSALPQIILIIGGQGAAAGIGPLVSDRIHQQQKEEKENDREKQANVGRIGSVGPTGI